MPVDSKFFESSMGNRTLMLKRNSEQEEKIHKELVNKKLAVQKKEYEERLKLEAELQKDLRVLREMSLKKELTDYQKEQKANLESTLAELKEKNEAYEKDLFKLKATALKTAETYEINQYKRMSAQKRRQYHSQIYEELKLGEQARKQELSSEMNNLKELQKQREKVKDKRGAGKAEVQKIDAEIAKAKKNIADIENEQKAMKDAAEQSTSFSKLELLTSAESRIEKREANFQKNDERITNAKENIAKKTGRLEEIDQAWKQSKAYQNYQKKIDEAKKKGNKVELANLLANQKTAANNWKKRHGYLKEEQQLEQELAEDKKELAEAQEEARKDTIKDNLVVAAGKAVSKAADNISGHLNDIYGSQGRMMGRLQGSDVKWNKSVFDVTTTVGVSGLVSQKNVVAKMVELVDSGVAYNLEMRAFLAETSQNIASTFDAANGTLLRMIRLQQADTTAARLGMEAMLTNLFNEYFSDTSYLTDKGPSDSVLSTIMDASATMDKNKSLEFEFTVQKWLGSLYSLGMSDQTIQAIAQGINYLGTGNVQALSGNTALQTLFAMSASRAGGKSFAQMLTTGLTADDTNKLLKAMVEYLAEIAEGQSNFVSKAAYADLFGMSLTDLSTFTSLTDTEISSLYESSTNFDKLTDETRSQLKQVISRVSMSQMLDTVIENAEVGAASLIGSNPVTYGMWKALAILKEYVGEVKIPGITGMGTGIASGLDLLNLAQTVMAGMGLIGSLVAGVASMAKGGAMNLDAWDFNEFTSRGSTLSILEGGAFDTTSSSGSIGVGSGDGSAVSDVSMESGKEQGQEASGITSEEMEEQQELPQKIYDALAGEATPNILSVLQEIDERLDPGRVFYTAIAGVLSTNAVSQVTNLSAQLANVTPPDTTNSNTTTGTSNAVYSSGTTNSLLTGEGHLTDNESAYSLEAVIASAIAEGLRQYSYGGNYVNIGSNSYWGGRP